MVMRRFWRQPVTDIIAGRMVAQAEARTSQLPGSCTEIGHRLAETATTITATTAAVQVFEGGHRACSTGARVLDYN